MAIARRTFVSALVLLNTTTASYSWFAVAHAQQPPTWSPSAFVAPATQKEVSIPTNSLRDSSSNSKGTTDSTHAARWQTPAQAVHSGVARSFARSIPVEVNTAINAESVSADKSQSKIQLASHTIPVESTEPKSSFELNQVLQRSAQTLQPKNSEGRKAEASHARISSNESNGGWHDRSQSTKAPLILASSDGNIATAAVRSNAPNENRTNREEKSSQIERTRFQEPKIALPETLSLPPAQNLPQGTAERELLNNPPAIQNKATDADTLPPADSTSRQGKSYLQTEPSVPNPFPSTQKPDASESPSDESAPPRMRPMDDDRAPPPPKRSDRSLGDCDSIRNFAKSADIRKVKVDSSPEFVEGIQGTKRTSKNTKEEFIANAPSRNWYDHNGQLIAQGKLVDLEFGLVIIEREDGARTTFNMRKLSDFDQAYVSQSWSIPLTCSIDDGSFPSRDFSETTMTWKASGACHKPLYFEDVQLERYGHEWGPFAQPVISTLHFFGNVAVLPYKMGIHPMNECQYSLGYYRPGSCAPWTVGPVPLSLRGAAMQAKFVTGTAWALP